MQGYWILIVTSVLNRCACNEVRQIIYNNLQHKEKACKHNPNEFNSSKALH